MTSQTLPPSGASGSPQHAEMITALVRLRSALQRATLPLALPGAPEQRAAQARETIAKLRAEAEQLADQAQGTQAALDGLAALRLKLLQRLPVPGLEIRDGELYFEGIAFERVNTAKRVKVAIRLAIERAVAKASGVPLIVVDGLECLDEATFAAFLEVAPETGAQLICSRVSDGPLTVKTYEPNPETATA